MNRFIECPLCGYGCFRIAEDSFANDVWECCQCRLRFSSGIGDPAEKVKLARNTRRFTAAELIETTWWRPYYDTSTIHGIESYPDIRYAKGGRSIILERTSDKGKLIKNYQPLDAQFRLFLRRAHYYSVPKNIWKPE